jgi:8-oxo-dGTP pyrophosphatase MutT (NUDIX family)
MEPGRLILKYFTESELRPIGQAQTSLQAKENLLTDVELDDICSFSTEFSKAGEAVVARSKLGRKPHLRAFVMFLHSLGAVSLEDTVQGVKIKGTGRLARHFPQLLSIYMSDAMTLVDNWNNTHIVPEDSLSAVELVRQMELRRIELTRRNGQLPQPLAERPVAFAIFHAVDQKGKDCYLFEINKDWRRLNFIGGKQEPGDRGDYEETVLREISEELGISRDRISLTRLNNQPLEGYSLSGNVGSLARYPCVLFGISVSGTVRTRMQDRWLTESTIKECFAVRDCPLMINPVYMKFLLEGQPSQISRTPVSTNTKVRSTNISDIVQGHEVAVGRWVRVMRENKDLLAAILTILAAVITLAVALS